MPAGLGAFSADTKYIHLGTCSIHSQGRVVETGAVRLDIDVETVMPELGRTLRGFNGGGHQCPKIGTTHKAHHAMAG